VHRLYCSVITAINKWSIEDKNWVSESFLSNGQQEQPQPMDGWGCSSLKPRQQGGRLARLANGHLSKAFLDEIAHGIS
jgi:hypothetical protein